MHIFELTRRLIEIESITENEKNLAFFLRDYLEELQYQVTLQEAAPNRFNVLALAGRPDLVFTTHLDTVPPYLPFREDDEYIYGRGACDAKGIIAAQIEAAERLRASGETRLGLLFLVGEERNSAGATHANRRPVGSRFYIDGEPTENKLAIGSKGSLRAEIVARGKAAHSAYPHMGIRDIETAGYPRRPTKYGTAARFRDGPDDLQYRHARRRHQAEYRPRPRSCRNHVPFRRARGGHQAPFGNTRRREGGDPLFIRSSHHHDERARGI